MRRLMGVFLVLLAPGCKSKSGERAEAQFIKLKERQAAEAKAKAAAREKFLAPQGEAVQLPAPYAESEATVILPDGPCPEGWWALFGGPAPGDNKEEQKANAARRKELADAARARRYLIKLRGQTVKASAWDEPKGKFDIEVAGTIDCTDSIGRIAIAWSEVKAGDPGTSAAKDGAEVTQNLWMAKPVTFALPMRSTSEAREWDKKNRFGLSARVAFTPGRVEVDRKTKKVGKVSEKAAGETLSFGGGVEDWGAGRLVHAQVLGLRVAVEGEKTQLFETR